MSRRTLCAFAQVWAALATAGLLLAQPAPNIEILQLRPNFYMIAGAGGSIAVQVGDDGAVVVDSGTGASAQAVVAAIKKIAPHPVRYIINTSADAEHVGGNVAVSEAGQTLLSGGIGPPVADVQDGPASILAAEQVLARMSAGQPPLFPMAAWPTEVFGKPRKYFYLNGEGIEIFHEPAAHTDGDSIVFFRRSDVVVAGDVFDITRFPLIDTEKGGTVQGVIAALQKLVDIAIMPHNGSANRRTFDGYD